MAAVLLLSGVQLVILGIVGEYLGRLYLTTNRKPQSVIREVRRSEASFSPERYRQSGRKSGREHCGGDPCLDELIAGGLPVMRSTSDI